MTFYRSVTNSILISQTRTIAGKEERERKKKKRVGMRGKLASLCDGTKL